MHERLEDAHERVFVVAKDAHGDLAGFAEDACLGERQKSKVNDGEGEGEKARQDLLTFDSSDPEAVDLVRGETERDSFLDVEGSTLRVEESGRGVSVVLELRQRKEKATDLLEQAVEIDMDGVTRIGVIEGVLAVPVSESEARKARGEGQYGAKGRGKRATKRTRGRNRPCTSRHRFGRKLSSRRARTSARETSRGTTRGRP